MESQLINAMLRKTAKRSNMLVQHNVERKWIVKPDRLPGTLFKRGELDRSIVIIQIG